MLVAFHTVVGVLALVTGAWNLIALKGSQRHRLVGAFYSASMYLLILTSFFIYEIFRSFGPFHVLAILSAATLTAALYFPLRRLHHRNWLRHHYFWITYSYVGLVMATTAHIFQYFPDVPFLIRALVLWGIPYVVGTVLIFGLQRRVLDRARSQRTPSVTRVR